MKRVSYLILSAFYRLYLSAGRRLSTPGLFLAVLLAVFALAGSDTRRTAAFQAFSFLFFLLAFSICFSIFFRGRFSISRRMGRTAVVGEPFPYDIVVENGSGRRAKGLLVRERYAAPAPSRESFFSAPSPRGGSFLSRRLGFYSFYALAAAGLGFRQKPEPVPELAPGASAAVRSSLVPVRRGRLRLSSISVLRPDPLGLAYGARHVEAPADVLVLPKTYPVKSLPLAGRRRHQAGGVALAGSVGDSQEFCGLRDYRPGDPLRHIHWRSFAKTGKPVVKEFCEEFFVRHALVLDTFGGDRSPALFEEAVSVAASFARAGVSGESLLDLMFVGTEAFRFTFGRGLGAAEQALSVLACVSPCRERPFSDLRSTVMAALPVLSGVLLVLLSWDDERRSFCRALAAKGVPILVLVVTPDSQENAPEESTPYRVVRIPVGQARQALASL
ncbi:MAG: DUF58 domain-containing protein [Thermodesulfobacteriota bacterium]